MTLNRREKEKRETRRTSAKEWAENQAAGFQPTAVKIPEGMEFYRLEEGKQLFDIMPYIAGPGNPNADEGFEHFERQYFLHRIPRPDGSFSRYCCLWETFKKPCPICLFRNDVNTRADQDLLDALRPQKRHLFIVNDRPGDIKNKLKVMDAVYFNRKLGFGEQLVMAINATRGGEDFASLIGGLTIQAMVVDARYGSVSRIDLTPRDYDYPDEMLDKAPCLDECLIEPNPSVLLEMLNQGGPGREASSQMDRDGESSQRSSKIRSSAAKEPEEEPAERAKFVVGDLVTYKELECEILNVLSDGKLKLEDEDENIYNKVDPELVKKVPTRDDEAEESGKQAKKGHDPDDDDDNGDEDDEPRRTAKSGRVK